MDNATVAPKPAPSAAASSSSVAPASVSDPSKRQSAQDWLRAQPGYAVIISFVSMYGSSALFTHKDASGLSALLFEDVEGALLYHADENSGRDKSADLLRAEKVFTSLLNPLDDGGIERKKRQRSANGTTTVMNVILILLIMT